jgi:hypothetical protein
VKKLFLILALLFPVNIFAYTGYYKAVTVQTGQVPSTQTNFPALLPFLASDTDFKDVAHGGHTVNGNSCYDIRPYSNSSLTTALTFELVTCDLTNGIFEMWVNIPSAADAYVVYVAHGDASFNSDGSSSSTWNTNYKSVWHMKDGSSLSPNDSTSNANTLTNNNTVTAITGQLDGGMESNGSLSYMSTTSAGGLVYNSAWTVEMWIKEKSGAGALKGFLGLENSSSQVATAYFDGTRNGFLVYTSGGGGSSSKPSSSITITNWNHLVIEGTGSARPSLYINGSKNDVNDGVALSGWIGTGTHIGRGVNTSFYANADIDEVRLYSGNLAADWITTEYNNQSNLATFWSKGSDTSTGGGAATCPKTITILGAGCDFSSLSLGSIPVNFNVSTNFTLSSDPLVGLFNYSPIANPIFKLFQDLGVAAKMDTTIATILNNYKILITDKFGNIIFP